jgi:hypothetical protein
MHIHEIFYYTIVKDSNNSTLCVINFEQTHILLDDRVTVLFQSWSIYYSNIINYLSYYIVGTKSSKDKQKTKLEFL